jgi:hypothetical protein
MAHLLTHDPVVASYRTLFALFNWSIVAHWQAQRSSRGRPPHPESAYLKAFLVRITEGFIYTVISDAIIASKVHATIALCCFSSGCRCGYPRSAAAIVHRIVRQFLLVFLGCRKPVRGVVQHSVYLSRKPRPNLDDRLHSCNESLLFTQHLNEWNQRLYI